MQREYTSVAYLPAFDTATRKLPEGGPTLFLLPEPPFELLPIQPEKLLELGTRPADPYELPAGVSPEASGRSGLSC